MVLTPRKFKFKSRHKIRRFAQASKTSELSFGQCGLRLLSPTRINSKSLFRLKLFLKKSSRKSDNTGRKLWFNAFPHLPLTKKSVGSRMGKGKGKLSLWYTKLPAGHVLVELKNLRVGRAFYFLKQIQFKIKTQGRVILRGQKITLHVNYYPSKVLFQTYW